MAKMTMTDCHFIRMNCHKVRSLEKKDFFLSTAGKSGVAADTKLTPA